MPRISIQGHSIESGHFAAPFAVLLREWKRAVLIANIRNNYRISGARDSMLVQIMDDVLPSMRIAACTEENEQPL